GFRNGATAWPSASRNPSPRRPVSALTVTSNYPLLRERSSCSRSLHNRPPWMNCCAASRTTTCPVTGIRGRQSARKSGEPQRCLYPGRGDAVWITLHPQAGHEQAGRRPALVLSPSAYNGRVGLALFCPITSQVRGYPFEVRLPAGSPVSGVVGGGPSEELGLARAQRGEDRRSLGGGRCPTAAAPPDVACRKRLTPCLTTEESRLRVT